MKVIPKPSYWKKMELFENEMAQLLQFCVFISSLLQDGDVGVGIFPECKEFFVICNRSHTGSVSVCPLRGSRL